jgi:large subunit ribosomal protein L18
MGNNKGMQRYLRLQYVVLIAAIAILGRLFYVQIIDDTVGNTLVTASSTEKTFEKNEGGNVEAAMKVGKLAAERALEKGITEVVFDRGGYLYHGRIQALAEAAREAGLKF